MGRKKKKLEFSKKLVAWALVTTTVCLIISYLLALFDHDPCSEITVSITTACIAIAVAYQGKSFAEKNSRNKYGIGKIGVSIETNGQNDNEEDEEALG